jgi:hypothetical protein
MLLHLRSFTGSATSCTLESSLWISIPYVKAGYQPKMYSVHTVMPEIHFPGYCPSSIPEYVMSQKKFYREPPITTFDREFVKECLVDVKPWYPLPDEPEFMLVIYELTEDTRCMISGQTFSLFARLWA